MEHSVHLGAHHFIKGVSPTTGSIVLKKVRHALNNAQSGDTFDLDQLDLELRDFHDDGTSDSNDEIDDDFNVGDAVGKALTLVKQVSILLTILKYFLTSVDRFVNHLKLVRSSCHHVKKLGFRFSSFCTGLRHNGHLYTISWIIF